MLAVAGCASESQSRTTAAPAPNRFDADRAWSLIKLQLHYGQRPAGSPQLRKLALKLRPRLPGGRFEAIPGDPKLRNVVGSLPGTGAPIVIGAHYDTLAKPKGFVGANNGAAGSAIVIEAARALRAIKRPRGAPPLRFVLFDGEEPPQGLPEEQTDFYDSGLRGSRAYVKAHPKARAMILLDYVANKGLRLPREGTSDAGVWARLRAAARRAGGSWAFPAGTGVAITDDHTPFQHAGIPAVDLIDWSYPGHSLADGLDKLSHRSVNAVGETVVELLRTWR